MTHLEYWQSIHAMPYQQERIKNQMNTIKLPEKITTELASLEPIKAMVNQNAENKTSSNVAHTPGPWNYVPPSYKCGGDIGVYATTEKSKNKIFIARVCDFMGTHTYFNPKAESNARLIAAAPELLEACRMFIDQYGSYPPSTSDGALNAARLAVCKAEGIN